MSYPIASVDATTFERFLPQLAELLVDGVHSGASISFIQPFSIIEATDFWQNTVLPNVQLGERLLFVALHNDNVIGTVQLIVHLPPNQAHRCEVSKLMVHTAYRGKGIARALMHHLLQEAAELDKSLVTLDTRSDDPSQSLYASLGFEVAGSIPRFAQDPDSDQLSATTYMYKFI